MVLEPSTIAMVNSTSIFFYLNTNVSIIVIKTILDCFLRCFLVMVWLNSWEYDAVCHEYLSDEPLSVALDSVNLDYNERCDSTLLKLIGVVILVFIVMIHLVTSKLNLYMEMKYIHV